MNDIKKSNYTIPCRDLGWDCNTVHDAVDKSNLLESIIRHLRLVHDVEKMPAGVRKIIEGRTG